MAIDNQDIVAEFVQESREHLADIENDLLAIEAAGAQIDLELVNKVFRSVHSVKGAAGFLGLTRIGELAHGLENVLNLIRNREMVPTSAVVDLLLRAADALRNMINSVETSNETDVSALVTALKNVIAGGTSTDTQKKMQRTVAVGEGTHSFVVTEHLLASQKAMGNQLYVIDFDLITDVEKKGKKPLDLVRELISCGELLDSRICQDAWGGLEDPLPESIRFMVLLGTVLDSRAMVSQAFGLDESKIEGPLSAPIGTDPPQAAPAVAAPPADPAPAGSAAPPQAPVSAPTPAPAPFASVASAPPPPAATKPAASPAPSRQESQPAETSVRVSVSVLDRLMNLAGELVLGRNQLLQTINARNHDSLESVGARLNQVTSELQEAIMQTRMQPIGTVFNKFPRVVRDLSGKLGKQCELVVEGKDVELDKSIIEAIGDPLTHLVRNAVDHGIEAPEARKAAGKNPVGRIVLRAFHQAGKVNISISDDGAGINSARLREKAVNMGLISREQAREMSEREAVRLIMHPGLSTAEKVTDVSGRGVGMDVVKTNIERLGGTVDIETQLGQGTTISVKLPLTLAIIPSLIVRCGDERYAMPQVSINELVRISAGEIASRIEKVKDAEVMRLRGSLLPLVRLSTALGIASKYLDPVPAVLEDNQRVNLADRRAGREPPPEVLDRRGGDDRRGDTAPGALNVIVVETGQLRYGLVVDGLHDSEEIVVKPLGRHLKGCPCLAGATILGDGKVALILDAASIAAHCQLAVPQTEEHEADRQAQAGGHEAQMALLFTNDPSELFAVPMGLIARIERIRAEQIDSVGGQEVLQYRGASLPLISLHDLLTARPRPQQSHYYVIVFRVGRQKQEIGLVAPQLVDIREISTELDTLTFRETGVLGSLVVDQKAARVLDLFELAQKAHPTWFAGPAAVAEAASAAAAGAQVLFAEDSAFFRKQVTSFLTDSGYSVTACEDGLEAWNTLLAGKQTFDVVVTDIEMPNLDGYELTRRIKQDPRFCHLPVIAVTSLAGQEDVRRGSEAGVDDYQIKLDRDQLLASVARYAKAAAAART